MPVVNHEGSEFHLSHTEEDKLNEFQVITDFPPEDLPDVVKLLRNHGWQLEPALSRYFDGEWKNGSEEVMREATHTPSRVADSLAPPVLGPRPLSFTTSLPVVRPLPANFRHDFRTIGLNGRSNTVWSMFESFSYDGNPFLFVLLLIPRIINRLSATIFTFFCTLLSLHSMSGGGSSDKPKISKVPKAPTRETHIPVAEVLGDTKDKDEFCQLKSFDPDISFNEALRIAKEEFKFILLVLVGDTCDADADADAVDVNSRLLLEKILLNKKTVQYLRKIDDELIIYLKCVQELEPWLIAQQLGVRNTPEIYLIANVSNKTSHSETVSSQRLSILSKLRINSLNKFLQSLTNAVERYSPELVVNRTEMHELRMSREIKKLQEDAYMKSLEMDRVKAIEREKSLKLAQDLKLKSTGQQLNWLKACVDELQPLETTEAQTTLQFRTSSGKRFIKKFPSMTTLYQIYRSIGCHIYLEVYSSDRAEWVSALQEKISQLAADDGVLCFKHEQLHTSTTTTITADELGDIINNELASFDLEQGKLEFNFELVSPFPKYTVHPDEEISVGQVLQLWPNGSLLVEAFVEEEEEEEGEKQ
ncbi:Ubx2p SKDI_13G1230 [Saccharomyces kudriavzevii IFO 1802]|uniref:UBX domain-containing protein n=1 Tax=Saccharomyces kudriavzevii (strain ATCC MYA-4449 / AS 2.2408 / CBS 8840 / NBRC 1802 / NCYC 2889) TaxID=226230 RepID=A0AA35J683_SACK1|nr:uncharacterized protein SKDI_13G1230 [Saccharomyces kudriavzevii IFO 1802]CAI4047852.1 hypothetical protein SKDI_13G1230 [Saccharomyces kudriavzevii IFO 1802]